MGDFYDEVGTLSDTAFPLHFLTYQYGGPAIAGSKMNARRVFVIWINPIFRESIRLLLADPAIECVGMTTDYEGAQEEILNGDVDTILVEVEEGRIPRKVLDILDATTFSGRLISCSLNDNRLDVYHREQWTVAYPEDLLHLILQQTS